MTTITNDANTVVAAGTVVVGDVLGVTGHLVLAVEPHPGMPEHVAITVKMEESPTYTFPVRATAEIEIHQRREAAVSTSISNVITVVAENIIAGDILAGSDHPVLSVGPHAERAEWVEIVVMMEDDLPADIVLDRARLIDVVRTETGA